MATPVLLFDVAGIQRTMFAKATGEHVLLRLETRRRWHLLRLHDRFGRCGESLQTRIQGTLFLFWFFSCIVFLLFQDLLDEFEDKIMSLHKKYDVGGGRNVHDMDVDVKPRRETAKTPRRRRCVSTTASSDSFADTPMPSGRGRRSDD